MMMLTRWQPWQEMEAARRQFDQLFNELVPSRSAATWTPAIELMSNDAGFTVRAQLPGIDANDLDVQVGRNAISISGEHKFENKTEEKGFVRSEFRYGNFRRVIGLPAPVQNDQVKAEFKDGVLTLTLPRLQAVQPSVVKLNLTESAPANLAEAAPQAEALESTPADAEPTAPETSDVWADQQ
jgi:HSP20 family protein